MSENSREFKEFCESLDIDDRRMAKAVVLAYCIDDIPRKIFLEAMELVRRSQVAVAETCE